jgi:hypothetical protein
MERVKLRNGIVPSQHYHWNCGRGRMSCKNWSQNWWDVWFGFCSTIRFYLLGKSKPNKQKNTTVKHCKFKLVFFFKPLKLMLCGISNSSGQVYHWRILSKTFGSQNTLLTITISWPGIAIRVLTRSEMNYLTNYNLITPLWWMKLS